MKDKKFMLANRISFILYSLYVLTYVVLPFVTGNWIDFVFLILPFIFTMGLIENVIIKYRKIDTNKISKVSEITSIFSTLINGFNSGALYVGTMDWNEKEKQIKRYPSIEPAWLFVIIITTFICSFPLAMIIDVANINTILIFMIISILFLVICQISSSFALYYNNGKDEMKKFWRNIIIVFAGFVIILAIVFFPLIKDMNIENKRKQDFRNHIDNINKTLKN